MNEKRRSPIKIIAVILLILLLLAAGVIAWIYFFGAIGGGEEQTSQQAIAQFDNAIADDPTNVVVYLDKAEYYLDNGSIEDAARTYADGYAATGSAIIADKLKAMGYNEQGRLLKELPDVTGYTETQAMLQLQQMGYITRLAEEHSETIPVGKVIGITPATGEMVPVGTEITMILSLGVPAVKIPDLTAMKPDEVKAFCEKNKLELKVDYKDVTGVAKDTILDQSIAADSEVERGTAITITVASGEAPETEMKFSFDIPASAEGVFEFTYYVDGKKDEEIGRDARNVGLASNKTLEYTVKGKVGETKTLTIEVTSSKTGRKDTFVVALITLSEQPTSEVKRMNMGIFSQLVS